MPRIDLSTLEIGRLYTRPQLATLWGYASHKAIERGVVTPQESGLIILFVTHRKQTSLTAYEDFLSGDLLHWEGETKHGSDHRIAQAGVSGEEIHLFYREVHHTPFEYRGLIQLVKHSLSREKPSRYLFQLEHDLTVTDDLTLRSHDLVHVSETERTALIKARNGQGEFRRRLIELWGGCSVTQLANHSLLLASHIKPWRDSSNIERLDPYNGLLLAAPVDHLFDKGLVTFLSDGAMQVSSVLSSAELGIFGVSGPMRLRFTRKEHQRYLEHHRERIFRQG